MELDGKTFRRDMKQRRLPDASSDAGGSGGSNAEQNEANAPEDVSPNPEAVLALEAARKALDAVESEEIAEVKAMVTPPPAVKLVVEAVCVLTEVPPDMVVDPEDASKKVADYWTPARKMMGDLSFLAGLKAYDIDRIPTKAMQTIRDDYVPNELFKPEVVAKASRAAERLCAWVLAMETYDRVAKMVDDPPQKEFGCSAASDGTVACQSDVDDTCRNYADLLAVAKEAKAVSDPIVERIAARFKMPIYQLKEGENLEDHTEFLKPFLETGVLIIAFYKNQTRTDAKARDKYKGDFAQIQDLVRYSYVCSRASRIQEIFSALESENEIDVVRTKNYFTKLDPTHYRRLGLTIRIELPRTPKMYHNGEVQVHFLPIWRDNPDHTHYEFFRELYGKALNKELGQESGGWLTINKRLESWSSFIKTPVLMALLVVVLSKLEGLNIKDVPSTTSELYRDAIEIIVKRTLEGNESSPRAQAATITKESVKDALTQLSFVNHCPQIQRQFTTGDVRKALRSQPNLISSLKWCFEEQGRNEYRVPTLKVLDDRGFDADETSFHTVHLSFQEYLAAEHITRELDPNRGLSLGNEADAEAKRDAIWRGILNHSSFINKKSYNNLFALASTKLAKGLFGKDREKLLQLTYDGIVNLTVGNWSALMNSLRLTLDVTGQVERMHSGTLILDALSGPWENLTVLELNGTRERICIGRGTKHGATLSSAIRKHSNLKRLMLQRCTFMTKDKASKQYIESVSAVGDLVDAVCDAGRITELGLIDCHLGKEHRATIRTLLAEGAAIQTLDLHSNKLDLITRIELVTWMEPVPDAQESASVGEGGEGSEDGRNRAAESLHPDLTRRRRAIFDGDPAQLRSAQRVHMNDASETILSLRGCTLQECDTEWLHEVIRTRPHLVAVNLDNNLFAEKAAECDAIGATIAAALAGSSVVQFSMCGARLGPATVAELSKILSSSACKLVELSLSENPLGDVTCSNLAKALGKTKSNPHGNQTLHTLNLRNVQMSTKSGQYLAAALKHGAALKELDLSVNVLTSKGAIKIFQYLELNAARHSLTKLNFAWNSINNHFNSEALVYGKVLGTGNTTLTHVDISYNKIGWGALEEICKSLSKDKVLRELNMSGNVIKAASGKLLKVALHKVVASGALEVVKVLDNHLSEHAFANFNAEKSFVVISGYLKPKKPV